MRIGLNPFLPIMRDIYWHIEGYDSKNKIYERKVKVGYFSQKEIQALLMALAAKAGLSFNEIVGAYAEKAAKIANELLSVQKDGAYPIYTCGDNPRFTARVIRQDA
jgi:hypothetical protein